MTSRDDFELDTLFSMPGVPDQPRALCRHESGNYLRPSVEKAYQIWLRGYKANQSNIERRWEAVLRMLVDEAKLTPQEGAAFEALFEAVILGMNQGEL